MQNSIQFDAHYIDCGDECIAYYTFGQGEPLVLLHGNGEGSEYFAKCIPYLSRFYRVIAVDSRGHGKSERGEGKLNFDRMAEDLRMVFDGLGLEKAHVLGFSDGGNLAIKFTLLYPQRVDKLILNGANVSMLRGVVPWVQLPVYPAVGLLTALSPLGQEWKNKRDVLALMAHGYGVRLRDLQLIAHARDGTPAAARADGSFAGQSLHCSRVACTIQPQLPAFSAWRADAGRGCGRVVCGG